MVNLNHYYEKYHKYIRAFVYNIIKDDPDDITQMSFYKLSQCDYIKNDAMACEFLKTAAKNMCIDYIRKRKRDRANVKKMKDDLNLYGEPIEQDLMNHIELAEIHTDVIQFIYSEIQKLPPMASKCFELHCLKDLPVKKVAEQLNIAERTVTNHISLARKQLKIEILFNKKDVLQLLAKRPKL